MNDIVVGSLHEGRVDIAEWACATGCQACRECYGVPFGDTYIEATLRHLVNHYRHRTSGRHSGRNADDALVDACEVEEGMSEDILQLGGVAAALDALSGVRVVSPWCMPYGEVALGGGIAVSLLRDDVEQFWGFDIL